MYDLQTDSPYLSALPEDKSVIASIIFLSGRKAAQFFAVREW
jgi:hypothetical protein